MFIDIGKTILICFEIDNFRELIQFFNHCFFSRIAKIKVVDRFLNIFKKYKFYWLISRVKFLPYFFTVNGIANN